MVFVSLSFFVHSFWAFGVFGFRFHLRDAKIKFTLAHEWIRKQTDEQQKTFKRKKDVSPAATHTHACDAIIHLIRGVMLHLSLFARSNPKVTRPKVGENRCKQQ